jgi:hypothetical protein
VRTTPPPCCQGLDEPCPQHQQQSSAGWNRGPRSRSGGGQRVVGDSGKARPAPEPTTSSSTTTTGFGHEGETR